MDLTSSVKQRALDLGFGAVGVSDLHPNSHGDRLNRWLAEGMAASMKYMHRQANRRLYPASILKGADRALVLTRNYFTEDTPFKRGTGLVAKYARGPDYHDTLRQALEELAEFMRSLGKSRAIAKAYVDAGPVPERELACRAGLGWIGKNAMLIDPKAGSFFFLGVVLTNLPLSVCERAPVDRCGKCHRCIDACPTGAILDGRLVDSRKCIAYLTIEHKGDIGDELSEKIGNRVFGCDICQDVCPWNRKFAHLQSDPDLAMNERLALADLQELIDMSVDRFEAVYGSTPLERPGLGGMRRNARMVMRNQRKLEADSDYNPVG